ncbi:mediator complex subunit 16 [Anticarsia gemmatalis]|uniref:mediator complex subunit 16 n=1 Tax=Anticarsia gemmatalis TaxID=129554 RepID=UPI003F769763
MELIYSMRRKPLKCEPPHFESPTDHDVVRPICTVSNANIIAFTSPTELTDTEGDTWGGHVYVCDLDTPWDSHKVTSTSYPVSTLEWDMEGKQLLVATTVGDVSVFTQKEYLLNEWTCLYTASFPGEHVISAIFFHNGRRVVAHDKKPEAPITERLQMIRSAPTLKGFGGTPLEGALIITATGLIGALTPPSTTEPRHSVSSSDSTRAQVTTDCLRPTRDHITAASFAHKNGRVMIAAVCGGGARSCVRCAHCAVSSAAPRAQLALSPLPTIYLPQQDIGPSPSMPVSISWWHREEPDSLLIAGSTLSLWKCTERSHQLHKLFSKGPLQGSTTPGGGPKPGADCFNTLVWQKTGAWCIERGEHAVRGAAGRVPHHAAAHHAVLATQRALHLVARDNHHYVRPHIHTQSFTLLLNHHAAAHHAVLATQRALHLVARDNHHYVRPHIHTQSFTLLLNHHAAAHHAVLATQRALHLVARDNHHYVRPHIHTQSFTLLLNHHAAAHHAVLATQRALHLVARDNHHYVRPHIHTQSFTLLLNHHAAAHHAVLATQRALHLVARDNHHYVRPHIHTQSFTLLLNHHAAAHHAVLATQRALHLVARDNHHYVRPHIHTQSFTLLLNHHAAAHHAVLATQRALHLVARDNHHYVRPHIHTQSFTLLLNHHAAAHHAVLATQRALHLVARDNHHYVRPHIHTQSFTLLLNHHAAAHHAVLATQRALHLVARDNHHYVRPHIHTQSFTLLLNHHAAAHHAVLATQRALHLVARDNHHYVRPHIHTQSFTLLLNHHAAAHHAVLATQRALHLVARDNHHYVRPHIHTQSFTLLLNHHAAAHHAVLATQRALHLVARDNHHYICSRPVVTSGGVGSSLAEASSTPPKKPKYGSGVTANGGSCAVVSYVELSALGGVAVAIDTHAQLHVYKLPQPWADIPTPMAVQHATSLLEYALVSGIDYLDVLIAMKPSVIEPVYERVTETFQRQPAAFQQYYFHSWLKLRIALCRQIPSAQSSVSWLTCLAALQAAWACAAVALRPDDKPDDKPLAALLDEHSHDHDKSLLALEAKCDTTSEAAALAPLRLTLQRVIDIALTALLSLCQHQHQHLMHHSYELWADPAAVQLLRKLCAVSRLAGRAAEPLLRVLARLAQPSTPKPDLIEECATLTSVWSGARVWESLPRCSVAAPHGKPHPLYLEYGVEPEGLRFTPEPPAYAQCDTTPGHYMDSIRYMYLGGGWWPARWRQCGRCGARALCAAQPARHALQRACDARFLPTCRCGGKWTLFSNI